MPSKMSISIATIARNSTAATLRLLFVALDSTDPILVSALVREAAYAKSDCGLYGGKKATESRTCKYRILSWSWERASLFSTA
jgi:hypothetical protein